MQRVVENLNWRSVIKKYDATKRVSDEDMNTLKEAIRLAPTSYGLQLLKVFIIEDPELRKRLQTASWGQTPVVDASHFLVFANYTKVDQAQIDAYFENLMQTRSRTAEQEEAYKQEISHIVGAKGDQQAEWTARQTYLLLGTLIMAAADMKIDVSPMEGFDPIKYNEILGLNEQNLNAAVVAAIGYRHVDDWWSPLPKIRKTEEELFVSL